MTRFSGYFSSSVSHGSGSICLRPREIFSFPLSTLSTMHSTSWPSVRILFGWRMCLVQDISEMWMSPSTPRSSSTKAPYSVIETTRPWTRGADRVLLLDPLPRVLLELLQAERDPLPLRLEGEDLDLELVADRQDLGRVLDAAVGDVGDVEQAVDAAQVDEGAEIGDVLDVPGADLPDLEAA